MGTAGFGLLSLNILIEHHYPIVGVVTVADKPAGRGQQVSASAIKQFALEQQLPILQPVSLKDPLFLQELTMLNADLFIVVAFRILPPEIFTLPKLGAFNLHASLLPKYRGAAPIQWAIINSEKETGVTTFFLDRKVDTGNVILQARLPIKEDETAGELHDRLAEVGAEMVLHSVRLIELGKVNPRKQDDALASPAPKIFKEHCAIDWKKSADEIHNLVRGLSPKPTAFTSYNGTTLKIYRTKVSDQSSPARPGEILIGENQLNVATGSGTLQILEIQQEGKKRMSAEEFLRGFHLKAGEIFS